MNTPTPLIVGAGFAGLLAAHSWPNAQIIDAAPGPKQGHKALLRFRTQAVSQLTGIEFKSVTARKAIYACHNFVQPNVRVCNMYARKVVGSVADRSIWNIDPVERFIAPEDFYEQLLESVGGQVRWGTPYEPLKSQEPVITTAPLPAILAKHRVPSTDTAYIFKGNPIRVTRWRVPGADVHQTVYFPDHTTPLYRASLCGDLMIAEEVIIDDEDYMGNCISNGELICEAFGLSYDAMETVDTSTQPIGKLQDLPAGMRKQILFELTSLHNVYTLGRFATWRNVLLDDVVEDIGVIKKIMRATPYDFRKIAS